MDDNFDDIEEIIDDNNDTDNFQNQSKSFAQNKQNQEKISPEKQSQSNQRPRQTDNQHKQQSNQFDQRKNQTDKQQQSGHFNPSKTQFGGDKQNSQPVKQISQMFPIKSVDTPPQVLGNPGSQVTAATSKTPNKNDQKSPTSLPAKSNQDSPNKFTPHDKNTIMIDDILLNPGRKFRPPKYAIFFKMIPLFSTVNIFIAYFINNIW